MNHPARPNLRLVDDIPSKPPGKRHRGHGEGSLYKRVETLADGSSRTRYVAELHLGVGPDGKRRVWRTSGKSRREVAAALAKAIEDHRRGTSLLASRRTLADYLPEWLAAYEPTVSAKWAAEVRRQVEKILIPMIGPLELGRIRGGDVQAFIGTLQALGRGKRNVQAIHGTLRQALNDAVRWDLIVANPAAAAKVPRPAAKRFTPWSMPQVKRFLAAISGDPDEHLYRIALLSGARGGELCALRWRDVSWDDSAIRIGASVSRVAGAAGKPGGLHAKVPKSEAGYRSIPLHGSGMAALRAQRDLVAGWREAAGTGWHENDLVFPARSGEHRDVTAARNKLARICARPDTYRDHDVYGRRTKDGGEPLPRFDFHDLRHQHASMLIALGEHIKVIQERLGHSSIVVTMDTYGHLVPGMSKAAGDRLGDALT